MRTRSKIIVGKETIVFDGQFMTVARMPFTNTSTGKNGVWEMSRQKGAVGNVVGILAITNKKEALVLRQYRIPLKTWIIGPCYGGMSPGESEPETARRELREETGRDCEGLIKLFEGPLAPARTDEHLSMYLGLNATISGPPAREDAEDIEVIAIPLAEAVSVLTALGSQGELIDIKLWGPIYAAREMLLR